jgi:hypothetical protein
MKWEKKGLIFSVDKISDWMYSHATVPFAEHMKEDLFRIYFATRDKQNRSHGAYIEVNILSPSNILKISKDPVLSPGPLGSFDDSGAMPMWIVNNNQKKNFYYIGWSLGVTVPFYVSIGLAESTNSDDVFSKISPAPILERNTVDPFLTASASIIIEDNLWKMWYLSGVKWEFDENKKPKHYYNIKYAESLNGVDWNREGIACIPFKDESEYAISRPCVIRENGIYKMWYSYRGGMETYRIGYAESFDGKKWDRKDEDVGIDVSKEGWDSDMIEYPFVFIHKGVKYLLYNGNDYGKSGFGYAILKES